VIYRPLVGGTPTDARVEALIDRGVTVVDARQTYVGDEVRLERVCAGVVLHPGSRLVGPRTFIGPNVEIGVEGPAVLRNAVLGAGVRIDGGFVDGAVMLDGARAGAGSHFRPGTLLEEGASTAHTVGLKHTVLLAFVTLGSLINFCDCLMAGGTSRSDHSEVGSGFIHFNYTPWGASGDKATPSLIGDVVHGVFLREPRIFLGGSGGLVGPGRVGFGSVVGAGQVVRRTVLDRRLVLEPTPSIDTQRDPGYLDGVEPRTRKNVEYIGQLVALHRFYKHVRRRRIAARPMAQAGNLVVIDEAMANLELCISERVQRLGSFLSERGCEMPSLDLHADPPCPLEVVPSELAHVDWVKQLSDTEVERGIEWLQQVVNVVTAA